MNATVDDRPVIAKHGMSQRKGPTTLELLILSQSTDLGCNPQSQLSNGVQFLGHSSLTGLMQDFASVHII